MLYYTLSYQTRSYYTVHSRTIVVGNMMQIALCPLFYHKNAAPIFSLHKYNYNLTCTITKLDFWFVPTINNLYLSKFVDVEAVSWQIIGS